MRTLYDDLRFGLRLLKNSPAFTLVSVLTLALGIAANTTVFSWIDGLLVRPFPGARDGHQLAVLEMVTPNAPNGGTQVSYLDYLDFRDSLKSVSGVLAERNDIYTVGDDSSLGTVWGELVSGNYFDVLGVQPAAGRGFLPEEDGNQPGAYPVAVISHRLWMSRFRGDRAAIGKKLRVNRHELTVVGVTPPEFRGTTPALMIDIWIPFTMGAELGTLEASAFRSRTYRNLGLIARLRPGADIAQARAEAAMVAARLAAMSPNTNGGLGATVLPVWKASGGATVLLLGPLRILMAVAVVLLLIVCANVANLLLARSVTRQREFGIRLALGAGRGRLARQMITESLLLSAAGALAGLPLSLWMSESLALLIPNIGANVVSSFDLNGRILGFLILTCTVAALVAGAAPALFSLRPQVNETLKEGGRSGKAGARSHRARGLLVISEVALAAMALIGAGLFLRSFQNARTMYPGFDRSNVLLPRFYLANAGYSAADVQRFCLRLRDSMRGAAGVVDVAYADFPPLGSTAGPFQNIQVEGFVPEPGRPISVNRSLVAPGYLGALRIPLLEGRDFTDADDEKAPPVLIVNQAFARRFYGGASPIGRKVRCFGQWHTIVGMMKDSKYFFAAEPPLPYFYAPFRQRYVAGMQVYFFLRTAGEPSSVVPALRRQVAAIDPNARAFHALTLADWTEVTLLPQKIAASLLAALGLLSLSLAAVGLYSVMAYAVTQRTQEFGIRMALGARPADVLGDVLRRGLLLTLAGLAAGAAAALAAARVIAGMLVNLSAADPLTFGGAAAFLAAVALFATYVPARRATLVDPMTALRWE